MTLLAALTCPLTGPVAQLGAPQRWRRRRLRSRHRKRAWEPASRAHARYKGTPTPRICNPPNSRESRVCLQGRAVALTFRHGAEGGNGCWRPCEGSAQAGPSLPSLGGETGERAAGTVAALAGGACPSVGLDLGAGRGLRAGVDWPPRLSVMLVRLPLVSASCGGGAPDRWEEWALAGVSPP